MSFHINWSDFWPNNRGALPDDHDIIVLSVTRQVAGVAGVRIIVGRAPNVTWWKGFRLSNAQDQAIGGVFGGFEAEAAAEHDFSMAQIGNATQLELWKAKAFGVHTQTYIIRDLSPLTPGTVIEFFWVQDTGGVRDASFASAIFSGVRSQDNQAKTFTVAPGANFQLETLVRNASTIAFGPALEFWVGSQNPQDNQTWGTNRWALGGDILPNNSRIVTLNLTAPTQAGSYPFSIRMVQEGVAWFGGTLDFSATVGTGATGPAQTCLLTGLALGFGLFNQGPPSEMLDGARLVRAQLQQSAAGARLVQLYNVISESGELESLISSDVHLFVQCLSFVDKMADCAHRTPPPELLTAVSKSLPEFEQIVDALHARSSSQTQAHLAEVRQLLRTIKA